MEHLRMCLESIVLLTYQPREEAVTNMQKIPYFKNLTPVPGSHKIPLLQKLTPVSKQSTDNSVTDFQAPYAQVIHDNNIGNLFSSEHFLVCRKEDVGTSIGQYYTVESARATPLIWLNQNLRTACNVNITQNCILDKSGL